MRSRLHPGDDRGSVLLLVLGLAAVAGLLVAVVVDASAAFLARRGLASIADGAAIAAASALDERALYTGDPAADLPLTEDGPDGVRAVVSRYQVQAASVQPGLVLTGGTPDGQVVVVTASRTVRLPFSGPLGVGDVTITATATARAPLTTG